MSLFSVIDSQREELKILYYVRFMARDRFLLLKTRETQVSSSEQIPREHTQFGQLPKIRYIRGFEAQAMWTSGVHFRDLDELNPFSELDYFAKFKWQFD
jgi:hypothetical protein